MPDEPDDLYFQDHCCQTFNWLTTDNVNMQQKLAGSEKARKAIQNAVYMACTNCKWPTPVRSWTQLTDQDAPPSCKFTLMNLERGNAPWKRWSEKNEHP